MDNQLIQFEWALKHVLRNEANFKILEGFLSELLRDEIAIQEILESDPDPDDRTNLKLRTRSGKVILINVEHENRPDFLLRMLKSASKAVRDHFPRKRFPMINRKVIAVNILFFDPGKGKDYVYHGATVFQGMHGTARPNSDPDQSDQFPRSLMKDMFTEYYLLNVKRFDNTVNDPLDEWIYYFKNAEIKEEFNARGLAEANETLSIMNLSSDERKRYEQFVSDLKIR